MSGQSFSPRRRINSACCTLQSHFCTGMQGTCATCPSVLILFINFTFAVANRDISNFLSLSQGMMIIVPFQASRHYNGGRTKKSPADASTEETKGRKAAEKQSKWGNSQGERNDTAIAIPLVTNCDTLKPRENATFIPSIICHLTRPSRYEKNEPTLAPKPFFITATTVPPGVLHLQAVTPKYRYRYCVYFLDREWGWWAANTVGVANYDACLECRKERLGCGQERLGAGVGAGRGRRR